MKITNAKYIKSENNKIVCINITINEQEMSVPIDTANRHYQAIQEWVAEGNTIEAAD